MIELILFVATTCAPCEGMMKTMDEMPVKTRVVQVDLDNPQVRAVPTLMRQDTGETLLGERDEKTITNFIKE